ncbi:MAG: MerR family transcriptional regulator, partial [Clostridiales bacterium]|nr:MerR family transcriptional regulator [Clostridiales bacterium]
MEYTVNKLGRLAGISTRTLRYYDEIGILKPRKTNSSGYRIYGRNEVDQLQQILFYRELGLSLEEIKEIITKPTFDKQKALLEHHKTLLEKRNRLDLLIKNVETTIESIERGIPMTDQEKFEGFKRKMIEDNEGKYGTEIRNKYGEDAVNRSNKKVLNMTKEQHEEVTKLANEIKETLSAAYVT